MLILTRGDDLPSEEDQLDESE